MTDRSNRNVTVLVTGASGFIAMHCIQQLLALGYSVRGTLRVMERADEVLHAVSATSGAVQFFKADLEHDEGWSDALKGADYVLHVASPFPFEQPKDEDELIIPARDGALRVLRAAKEQGVKRVVMTSSLAAVMADRGKPADHVYTSADWTNISDKHVSPYEKSKTISEQAAWAFAHNQDQIELTTILPGGVLGPLLSSDFSASADIVRLIMARAMPACPRLGFNLIDVRDVAAAHISAMRSPRAAGQRYVCAIEPVWLRDIAHLLKAHFEPEGWRVPTGGLPDFVVKLGGLFDPTMKRIAPLLGRQSHVDYAPLETDLGISLRSNKEMTLAMAESLIAHGVIRKP